MSSIIIDTNIMTLYDAPIEPTYAKLFKWLEQVGTLYVSQYLLTEYGRSGNQNIVMLLAHLNRHAEKARLIKISNQDIKRFKDDKNIKYTCNKEDIYHAKLTFLSPRKKIITEDKKLAKDINNFKKVSKIKPTAIEKPEESFYL